MEELDPKEEKGGTSLSKKPKKPSEKALEKLRRLEAEIAEIWNGGKPSGTDVLGSYTGNPEKEERPRQDADDL